MYSLHSAPLRPTLCRYLGAPRDIAGRIDQYFDYLTTYSHPGPDGMALISQLPSSMFQVGAHAGGAAAVLGWLGLSVQRVGKGIRPDGTPRAAHERTSRA